MRITSKPSNTRTGVAKQAIGGLVMTLLFAACGFGSVETTQAANAPINGYDEGFIHGGSSLCSALESEIRFPDALDGRDVNDVQALVDSVNGHVIRIASEAGWAPDIGINFISGMWDGATVSCPQWFPDPTIVGRPAGGEVQPVQASLELELAQVIARSAVPILATTTTSSLVTLVTPELTPTQFQRISASSVPALNALYDPSEVWIGDPDGDGILELALVAKGADSVTLIVGELAGDSFQTQWENRLDFVLMASIVPAPDLNRDGFVDVVFTSSSGGSGQLVDWLAVGIKTETAEVLGNRELVPYALLSYSPLGIVERSSVGDSLVVWENGQLEAYEIDIAKPADAIVITYRASSDGVELTLGDLTVTGSMEIEVEVGSLLVLERDKSGEALHNVLTQDGDIFGHGDLFGELSIERSGQGTILLNNLYGDWGEIHVSTPGSSQSTPPPSAKPESLDPASIRQFVRAIFSEFLDRAPRDGELDSEVQKVVDLYDDYLMASGPFDLNARYRESFLATFESEIRLNAQYLERRQQTDLLRQSISTMDAMVEGSPRTLSP